MMREPIITISRQSGAGAHAVAEILVDRLGGDWKVCDKDIIDELARSAQVGSRTVASLDERRHSWMDEMIRTAFQERVLDSMGYHRHLARVLLTLAHEGHNIIIGRGANFLLSNALNVRLEAPEAFRARYRMGIAQISYEEAVKLNRQVDRERASFTRSIFDRDTSVTSAYEMVLQTDKIGFDGVAAIIEAAWHEKVRYNLEHHR
jgi:cytidylate kinase